MHASMEGRGRESLLQRRADIRARISSGNDPLEGESGGRTLSSSVNFRSQSERPSEAEEEEEAEFRSWQGE